MTSETASLPVCSACMRLSKTGCAEQGLQGRQA